MGSTLGSFTRHEAAEFLGEFVDALNKSVNGAVRSEPLVVIGLDGCKDGDKVWHAYNDAEGKNDQFNRNALNYANHLLGENMFHQDDWERWGECNDQLGRHEQYLIPRKDIWFRGHCLKAGEKIFVVASHKYDEEERSHLWEGAGLSELAGWQTHEHKYGVYILSTKPSLLTLVPSILAVGSAVVVNNCGSDVYFASVGQSAHSDMALMKGGYSEPFTKDNVGISIKLSPSMTGAVTQFEYTWVKGQNVAYDISNIDGNPFSAGGMSLVPSMEGAEGFPSCVTVNCPAGQDKCDAAYNLPDDVRTKVCPEDSVLTFTLCTGGKLAGGDQPAESATPAEGSSAGTGQGADSAQASAPAEQAAAPAQQNAQPASSSKASNAGNAGGADAANSVAQQPAATATGRGRNRQQQRRRAHSPGMI
ncbi:hypothetical protein OHC33_003211 [Knufia fluminis]|uniref:Histidine-specific methyltransferase SAM-dependent domain-containing protein n=1 Tax=Knufia fluminis TaxID=191047 RepID=A0AAN8EJX1_9EURO|nr:hypothetical protein OHC33_003211 [Knufia fluminis]